MGRGAEGRLWGSGGCVGGATGVARVPRCCGNIALKGCNRFFGDATCGAVLGCRRGMGVGNFMALLDEDGTLVAVFNRAKAVFNRVFNPGDENPFFRSFCAAVRSVNLT